MNRLVSTFLRQVEADGLDLRLRDDLDDLLTLHAAAEAFTGAAPSREYAAHLEPELHIGGAVLRRLSIGARDFFNERPAQWFAGDEEWYMRSLVYCLAEGGAPGALWAFGEKSAWKSHVAVWSRSLSCSWKALRAALGRFLAVEASEPGEDRQGPLRADYGFLVEALCSEYGHDPAHWIWGVPEETIDLLWSRLVDRKDAEARASGRGGVARDPDVPATRALYRYRETEARLIEKLRSRKA